MYYNTDVAKKAGLLDSDGNLKPIVGTDGFTAALKAAAKVTGGYGGVVNVINDPSTCWRWFSTLYYQLGGQVLADDGRTVALDDAKATRALSYIRELTVQRKLMPSGIDGGGVTQLFSTGKVGFLLDGEWDVTTYATAKTPFNMVPLPNFFGGKYTCWADSHALILPEGGNPDTAHRQVALTFVRSLLDNSLTWAQGGHIPAWKPVQDSKAYKTLKPQSNYTQAAYAASYDPPGWYSGAGSDFETVVGSAVSAVETGQLSPEAGVAQMRSGLTSYTTIKPPVA
jgi:multiple sugar transport system substrate-binding protein